MDSCYNCTHHVDLYSWWHRQGVAQFLCSLPQEDTEADTEKLRESHTKIQHVTGVVFNEARLCWLLEKETVVKFSNGFVVPSLQNYRSTYPVAMHQ